MILVKRVGRQESGLSKDNSKRVRGPYLYITKRWLRYFPSLSSTQENDAAPLVIESRDYKRVVLPFVWHNSHAVQNKRGGRNEYRLYITGLESTGIPLPIPGDLVLLQPIARREGDGPHDRFTLIFMSTGEKRNKNIILRYISIRFLKASLS